MTISDPMVRQKYFHLARVWREMADHAERGATLASHATPARRGV
jgi:hypothetical protein